MNNLIQNIVLTVLVGNYMFWFKIKIHCFVNFETKDKGNKKAKNNKRFVCIKF